MERDMDAMRWRVEEAEGADGYDTSAIPTLP